MVEIKTAGEIDAMAAAGRITAQALAAAREAASVGVTLLELDAVAAEVISGGRRLGAVLELPAGNGNRRAVPRRHLCECERCCGARYPE